MCAHAVLCVFMHEIARLTHPTTVNYGPGCNDERLRVNIHIKLHTCKRKHEKNIRKLKNNREGEICSHNYRDTSSHIT